MLKMNCLIEERTAAQMLIAKKCYLFLRFYEIALIETHPVTDAGYGFGFGKSFLWRKGEMRAMEIFKIDDWSAICEQLM